MVVAKATSQLGFALEVPDHWRPSKRADCLPGGRNECRPCPYVGCKHHTFLQVLEDGRIQFNHPDGVEPWEIEETCVLDQADHGGLYLGEAAPILGMTSQWMNVIERAAREKLAQSEDMQEHVEENDGMTLDERVLRAFASLTRKGQRMASSPEVYAEMNADVSDPKRQILIHCAIRRLVRIGELRHDGGRADGKGANMRLYWLAEEAGDAE